MCNVHWINLWTSKGALQHIGIIPCPNKAYELRNCLLALKINHIWYLGLAYTPHNVEFHSQIKKEELNCLKVACLNFLSLQKWDYIISIYHADSGIVLENVIQLQIYLPIVSRESLMSCLFQKEECKENAFSVTWQWILHTLLQNYIMVT